MMSYWDDVDVFSFVGTGEKTQWFPNFEQSTTVLVFRTDLCFQEIVRFKARFVFLFIYLV